MELHIKYTNVRNMWSSTHSPLWFRRLTHYRDSERVSATATLITGIPKFSLNLDRTPAALIVAFRSFLSPERRVPE
jgi:hypothetical protein